MQKRGTIPFTSIRHVSREGTLRTSVERGYGVESEASYTGDQDEGGRVYGCLTEAVHNRRVKSMQWNLTNELDPLLGRFAH